MKVWLKKDICVYKYTSMLEAFPPNGARRTARQAYDRRGVINSGFPRVPHGMRDAFPNRRPTASPCTTDSQ